MTREELKKIEEGLLSEKSKLESELKKLKENLDFGDDTDHYEEETDEAEERGVYLGIKKTHDARLGRIQRALDKIKSGKYGICEKCGGPIEKNVLEVDPESLYCKNCKRGL